jgi:hypothetical protein
MSDAGIKVKNFKEVRAALRNVGVPKEAVKDAARSSAKLVQNEAITLVPVRTGKLRDSIRIGAYANGKITLQAGNNRKTRSGVPYANPIHWGWFKRNIKPQPFFSKALGYTRAEIFRNYFSQLDKLIDEESRKAKP